MSLSFGSMHPKRAYGTIGEWRSTGSGWTTRNSRLYVPPLERVSRVQAERRRCLFDVFRSAWKRWLQAILTSVCTECLVLKTSRIARRRRGIGNSL